MGILERFSSIMSANLNALLDKCEDPSKMVAQYLLGAKKDLAAVKKDTAEVMAEETRCKRELAEVEENISKYHSLATSAVTAGNDEDARVFLQKKQEYVARLGSAQATFNSANVNATRMRDMHNKLVADISMLETKRNQVKSAHAVAKTQKRMNDMLGRGNSSSIGRFDAMEDRVQQMLDTAEAETSLNASATGLEDLEEKYSTGKSSTAVEDDLAALKASLGK